MSQFLGRWKLESTENFEEYMKAVGVGMVLRKVGSTMKPDLVISKEGDDWKLRTESTFKTTEINFKLDTEFDEETADGRKVKTTMSLVGENKLIQSQKGDVDTVLNREITDDNTLTLVCEAKDVKSTRVYKRVVADAAAAAQ